MCRACSDPSGGRRCPTTNTSREQGRAAAKRYYARGKARLLIAQLADHGIAAVDDTELPPTYHAARPEDPLDLSHETTISLPKYASPDKPQGALWTSPGRVCADGTVKTGWTDREARELMESQPDVVLYVVRPKPGAVIAMIETPADAEALMTRYETTDVDDARAFDWAAMQKDGIDGIYVSPSAVRGTLNRRGTASENLWGWDTTSVAWLSNRHLEVDPEVAPTGTYEIVTPTSDDDEYASPKVSDPDIDTYVLPARPAAANAWSRVPKKVRESKAASSGPSVTLGKVDAASEGEDRASSIDRERPDGSPRVDRARAMREGASQRGAPKEPEGLLDLGRDALDLLREVTEEERRRGRR